MKFSVIIPSYNQPRFIAETLDNVRELKQTLAVKGHLLEVLMFDSCSIDEVQEIIHKNRDLFDVLEIEKDQGQYDAINKGIAKVTGDYWTWLNTDDLINIQGFLEILKILTQGLDPIDYIYGGVELIDENSKAIKVSLPLALSIHRLVNVSPSIYQQGSFFRKEFTNTLGLLNPYRCCFDYEYVLRALSYKARVHICPAIVGQFRLHSSSKTGSIVPVFVREQLLISKKFGRNTLSWLAIIGYLRLIKRKITG